MSEENKSESIDVDSISWGSAAKDAVNKVYGNYSKNPLDVAKKIEVGNVMRDFALGKISHELMKTDIETIESKYGGK